MENRLIDIKEVSRMTGLGRSTIYKKIKSGEFLPGVVKFSRRRWWLYDIVNFMDGEVTVNAASEAGSKPPRVKLAKHRIKPRKLSPEKPKTPPTHLEVSKNLPVSGNPHNKLSVKRPIRPRPQARSA